MSPCAVYVMTTRRRTSKIGFSADPNRRQSMVTRRFGWVALHGDPIWLNSRQDARKVEAAAHRALADSLIAGETEWFAVSGDEAMQAVFVAEGDLRRSGEIA